MNELHEAARAYRNRNWSFVPVVGKEAAVKWGRFARQRPSADQIDDWFGTANGYTGIAVIPGAVSDRLAVRDFDDPTSWKVWYDNYPDFADMLPAVQTWRGAHVYCRAKQGSLEAVRHSLGCEGTGAIDLGDGELRADVGCYCVAPPSQHPDGGEYRWLRPLGAKIPEVDLLKAGFIPAAIKRRADRTQSTQDMSVSSVSSVCGAASSASSAPLSPLNGQFPPGVSEAIASTLPNEGGQRHKLLFRLAQKLRGIREVGSFQIPDLRPIVQRWHHYALPVIRTKEFDQSWAEFVHAWERIIYPGGREPIRLMYQEAIESTLPQIAMQYDTAQVRTLVALCRRLQQEAGDKPFFLAGRPAAELIGLSHRQTADYFRMLIVDRVLSLAKAGTRHKAAEYRYLGD